MRGKQPEPDLAIVHELTIPDELLAWGKQRDVARTWARPWAHEVERLLTKGARKPLNTQQTEALLSRLEALCIEAIRSEKGDLLLGFDVFTAAWLGLVFGFETGGERVEVGAGCDFEFSELHVLFDADAPPDALAFATQCKELVGGVFPHAQISAIVDEKKVTLEPCSGCGEDDCRVMITLVTGSRYCRSCWADLMAPWPTMADLKKRQQQQKRTRRRR